MVNNHLQKILILLLSFFISLFHCSAQENLTPHLVKISFVNTVKAMPLILDSAVYTNPFGEQYRVSRLKYYIGNVSLHSVRQPAASHIKFKHFTQEGYHLINEEDTASLNFNIWAGIDRYDSISFLIGVDSIKNVSGAQTDALDPANGMFWTWNSGYIFFKLEGNSPSSTIINHKVEYHIGGFEGMNNALRTVTLPLNSFAVKKDGRNEIIILADLDKLWLQPNPLKIAETAVTMTPGILSKKIADNYSRMFSIKEVKAL